MVGGVQKLLFDAESKNHKIPNSHYGGGGEGGGSVTELLMLSPKIIKSQKHTLPLWTPNCKWHIKLSEPISIYGGGGGPKITFWCWVQKS